MADLLGCPETVLRLTEQLRACQFIQFRSFFPKALSLDCAKPWVLEAVEVREEQVSTVLISAMRVGHQDVTQFV